MGGFCWIASYPKSGNTWMRLLLRSLLAGGAPADLRAPIDFAPVAAQRSDMDLFLDVEGSELTPPEVRELRHDLACVMAAEGAEPLYRKVHDCWDVTPSGRPLFPPAATRASVYLVRDPRDVAISWAHHTGDPLDTAIAFLAQEDAELAAPGGWRRQFPQRLMSWSRHVESWLGADPAPLVLSYEQMSRAPGRALEAAAAHFGLPAPPQAVAQAVEANRFERLRAAEAEGGFDGGQVQSFFRRGVAGGWRDTLTPAQARRIARDHGAVMARLGYL